MTAVENLSPAAGIISCLAFWKQTDGIEVFQLSCRRARDTLREL